jgi:NTP pyrophosphatase (non-canonical NTP hydrolase)
MGSPTYLHFRDYQRRAGETAVYPGMGEIEGLMYVGLGAAGEAGEIADKIKKVLRDDHGIVTDKARDGILKEVGGTLWYLAQICGELGASFEDVAEQNLAILADRKERGVIHGSGDDR